MKGGSDYGKLIKKLFNKLKRESSNYTPPEEEDLIDHLLRGILSANVSDTRVRTALRHIKERTVDMNDFRVTPVGDMVEILGKDFPDGREKAVELSRALNGVFKREQGLDLSSARQMGKREAREYLESITNPHAAAWTLLYGLGGHAIPVDDQLLAALRKDELVDLDASIREVQAFLERNVSAADAPKFVHVMRKYAAAKAPRLKPKPAKTTKAAKRTAGGKTRAGTKKKKTKTAKKYKKTKKVTRRKASS